MDALDWREIIGFAERKPAARSGPRPLSFLHALLIAIVLEAAVALGIMLWAQWRPSPTRPAPQPVLTAHLLRQAPTPAKAAGASSAKGGVNPRVGNDGGRRRAPRPHPGALSNNAGPQAHAAGGPAAAAAHLAPAAARPKRRLAAALRADGVCVHDGCVPAMALHRFEQRLHALLQARLNAQILSGRLPPGFSLTLRFVATAQGGAPAHIALLDAPVAASAEVRQMRRLVENTRLPPFPRDLGARRLTFEVTLSR